ncbi:MAG: hypothetical protein JW870_18710 [Candidatus Delongbacteria bacterium]|nr:hypothetical protein [Candidatus Delongbacteria bacterium]
MSFIVVIGLIFNKATKFDWGHHFDFTNNLGIRIDSLHIFVGDEDTWIYSSNDSLNTLNGNINVPTDNYPHKVEIHVFRDGELIKLPADSFDCYNCDGNHEYILYIDSVLYRFNP